MPREVYMLHRIEALGHRAKEQHWERKNDRDRSEEQEVKEICFSQVHRDFPSGFLPTTGLQSFLQFWLFSSCFMDLLPLFSVPHRLIGFIVSRQS